MRMLNAAPAQQHLSVHQPKKRPGKIRRQAQPVAQEPDQDQAHHQRDQALRQAQPENRF